MPLTPAVAHSVSYSFQIPGSQTGLIDSSSPGLCVCDLMESNQIASIFNNTEVNRQFKGAELLPSVSEGGIRCLGVGFRKGIVLFGRQNQGAEV